MNMSNTSRKKCLQGNFYSRGSIGSKVATAVGLNPKAPIPFLLFGQAPGAGGISCRHNIHRMATKRN